MNFTKNIKNKNTLCIDIGSKYVRYSVFSNNELIKEKKDESAGIEYGLITDEEAFSVCVEKILSDISREVGFIPRSLLVTISTSHQNCASLSVITHTKRADGVITDLDIENIKDNARKKIEHLKDKIILHEIIIRNKVDGSEVLGDLRNAKGMKIESKVLFIYDDMHNYKLLNQVFDSLNVEIEKVLSGPLVEAELLLSSKEKRLGTAVLNIGHHISSLTVYERGVPLLSSCLPYGGEIITSKIALLLRTDPDNAEDIKINFSLKDYSKRRCDEIIDSSVHEFCLEINAELSRIKRQELLPGGVRIIGGSSGLSKVENYIKYNLSLPSVNTAFDSRYAELSYNVEYIKNYAALAYSDNINEIHIYKNWLKKNYLLVRGFLSKFLP